MASRTFDGMAALFWPSTATQLTAPKGRYMVQVGQQFAVEREATAPHDTLRRRQRPVLVLHEFFLGRFTAGLCFSRASRLSQGLYFVKYIITTISIPGDIYNNDGD